MKKSFAADVLKSMPGFTVVDTYFCERPIGHFLRGFLFEKRSTSVYVWKFIFPLFDRLEFIHLGFSEVLTDDLKVEQHQSVSEAFVQFVEPHRSAISLMRNLSNFLTHAESLNGLSNPWIRRGYAMTLIMLERTEDAFYQLKILADTDAKGMSAAFQKDIMRLLNDLSLGISVAKDTLITWEAETKAKLKILNQ